MKKEDVAEALAGLSPEEQEAVVAEYFRKTPLSGLGKSTSALANVVYAHRLANKGLVPFETFESVMGIGGITVSAQIVHEVLDPEGNPMGFALRLREEDEVGDAYRGKYHNTCCSLRWSDTMTSALERDDADAFDGAHGAPLTYLGVTYHHEAPRRSMDLTFMYRRRISFSDIKEMHGNWKFFSFERLMSMVGKSAVELPIVESNHHQLLWAMTEDAFRPTMAVLRGSFPKELLPK